MKKVKVKHCANCGSDDLIYDKGFPHDYNREGIECHPGKEGADWEIVYIGKCNSCKMNFHDWFSVEFIEMAVEAEYDNYTFVKKDEPILNRTYIPEDIPPNKNKGTYNEDN